jgi:predicted nucleic acid-binding protein
VRRGGRPAARVQEASGGGAGARHGRGRGFVLDSHALLAYFEGEASGALVRTLIRDAEQRRARLYVSLINWGEVFYIVRREKGELAAHEVIARLDVLPIILRSVDRQLVLAAATLKAAHPIAYADAFAAATANLLNVPVVTGDPEFRRLEPQTKVVWTTKTQAADA